MSTKQTRFKDARKRKGPTRQQVADRIFCSVHTYRHWEIDAEPRTTSLAQKVCDVVGIDH